MENQQAQLSIYSRRLSVTDTTLLMEESVTAPFSLNRKMKTDDLHLIKNQKTDDF